MPKTLWLALSNTVGWSVREHYGRNEALEGFSEPVALTGVNIARVPDSPGVHVVWDEDGQLMYVGHTSQQRTRLREHVTGNRQKSILCAKVGRTLDEELGRPATTSEVRSLLERWTFAWRATDAPEELKARVMDELHPPLNEVRPGSGTDVSSVRSSRPDAEPLHLLLKWTAEHEPATIQRHMAVAASKGSVWWGRLGTPGSRAALSDRSVARLREQLTAGTETHCYLYRKDDLWRARLEAITKDPGDVEDDLLPGYYSKADCNLFVRLSDFQQLNPDWPLSHLVLARDPQPMAMAGALQSRATLMLVIERFEPSPGVSSVPKRPTVEWLEEQTLWPRADLQELLLALQLRLQIILAGPPGTGKTWMAKRVAEYLTGDAPDTRRVLQFHPSYGYEEFIEGLRPVSQGDSIAFRRENGAVLRAALRSSELGDQPYVLVLDEMNRANLPRVFGELMYLLEYRNEPVNLLFSRDFSLPGNLLFIGTMNTADRSIRSIDIALRRRFEVFECLPSQTILRRYYETRSNEVPDLLEGFEQLNQRLEGLLDRHHTVGHTFFMADQMTPQRLRATWRRQLTPLLQEYFFDEPDVANQLRLEELWPSVRTADAPS